MPESMYISVLLSGALRDDIRLKVMLPEFDAESVCMMSGKDIWHTIYFRSEPTLIGWSHCRSAGEIYDRVYLVRDYCKEIERSLSNLG